MVQVTEQAQYKVNNDRAAAQVVKKSTLARSERDISRELWTLLKQFSALQPARDASTTLPMTCFSVCAFCYFFAEKSNKKPPEIDCGLFGERPD